MKGEKPGSQPSTGRPSGIHTRGSQRSGSSVGSNMATTPKSPKTPDGSKTSRDPSDIERVLNRLDTIETRLESKIEDAIRGQELSAENLNDRFTKAESKSLGLEERVSALKDRSDGTSVQLKVHGARITEIEAKIERIERERRRNVLVIDGAPEKEGDQPIVIVNKIFADLQVGFTADACTAVFRRGRNPNNDKVGQREDREQRPRPIIVILPSQAEKAQIFRNLKNLKDKEEWKKVYFNDDLTEQQASEQRDLRSLAAFAKSRGFNAQVKAGALSLDGRRFRYDELHRLPEGISLLHAKNLIILDDKGLVFQSPHSPLSNLYPCNITYRGEAFLSAEGAFQYTRATICGYHREAQLIKSERNAFKVKSLTRDFRNIKEWEDMSEQVMREVLIAKFKSNRACLNYLVGTGQRSLFEGTGDRKWGCGIPISKANLITFKNPGRNLLGHMLEETRKALIAT